MSISFYDYKSGIHGPIHYSLFCKNLTRSINLILFTKLLQTVQKILKR